MADDSLFTLSEEQMAKIKPQMDQMKAIVDNKQALLASGVFTIEQIKQIEASYDLAKKMTDLYNKK